MEGFLARLRGVRAISWAAAIFMMQIAPASAKMKVEFPLTNKVGGLQAGQLCFPKGSLRGTDFVADEDEFDFLVRQALDEQSGQDSAPLGTSAAPRIAVHLKSAAVKLCAKSWGMFGLGDTKSLSGTANFTFAWRKDGQGTLATETIALEVNVKDRLTAPAILRRAVITLLSRLAASEQ